LTFPCTESSARRAKTANATQKNHGGRFSSIKMEAARREPAAASAPKESASPAGRESIDETAAFLYIWGNPHISQIFLER
jgi:hypothetical protein